MFFSEDVIGGGFWMALSMSESGRRSRRWAETIWKPFGAYNQNFFGHLPVTSIRETLYSD
jgi:hypothetical protein